MSDDLRRSVTNLLGTIAVIGAALAVVFGLKSIQVAIYGPVIPPPPMVITVEVTVEVTMAITATPGPLQAEGVNLTPTRSGDWGGTEPRPTLTIPPTSPTTPIPGFEAPLVDFAGDIPDTDKRVVVIERADGQRHHYVLPKNVATEFTNLFLIGPGDVVIGGYPLVELAYTGPAPDQVAPTAIPPVEEIIDLARDLPDEAVFVYIVRGGDGRYTQYLAPKAHIRLSPVRRLLRLRDDQQIVRTSYLAGLPSRSTSEPTRLISLKLPDLACETRAIGYISRRYDLNPGDLSAGVFQTGPDGEWPFGAGAHLPDYPLRFEGCLTQVYAPGSQRLYQLAFDRDGLLIDLAELPADDIAPCARFEPALCQRLMAMAPAEQVEVAIWLTAIDYSRLYDLISARHRSTVDPTVSDPVTIAEEIEFLIGQAYQTQAAPLLRFLQSQGVTEAEVNTWAPVITVTAPKAALLALVGWKDVVSIELVTEEY